MSKLHFTICTICKIIQNQKAVSFGYKSVRPFIVINQIEKDKHMAGIALYKQSIVRRVYGNRHCENMKIEKESSICIG